MKLAIFLLIASQSLLAGSIIQVSRRLPLTNSEVPPKDIFIDIGEREGIKEGDQLSVYRWVPVMDAYSGQPYHLLRVHIGELVILQVGEAVSVARSYKERAVSEIPGVQTAGFMLGDQIILKTQLPRPSTLP